MPKHEKIEGGSKLILCRGPKDSPDFHIMSANAQKLEFVYSRRGQVKDYGPDRRWNNLLMDGSTVFEAGVPPLLRVMRFVEEEKMQLQDADGEVLTDVVRVVRGKGYNYPDIRHRFSWRGRTYLLEAQKVFTGKNFTCRDDATGELILTFATTLKTFFAGKTVGEITVSSKVAPEDFNVILGAFLSYQEFDGRRTLLVWGESYLIQDVVA